MILAIMTKEYPQQNPEPIQNREFPEIKKGYTVLPFPEFTDEYGAAMRLDEVESLLQAFTDHIHNNGGRITNVLEIPVKIPSIYSEHTGTIEIKKKFAIVEG